MKTLQGKRVVWLMAASFGMFLMQGSAHATKFTKGDPKKGAVASAACQGCHGEDGNSLDSTFPRLAGQYEGYIVKQVTDFQKNKRTNNDTMAGMAMMVTDPSELHDIAAYFSSKKMAKKPLVAVSSKKVKAGEKIFKNGIPSKGLYGCINCHGVRGKGRSAKVSQFPRIGGQHKAYIIKELKDLKAGRRSNDPGGMMRDIAKKLNNKEREAVASYLSAQLP